MASTRAMLESQSITFDNSGVNIAGRDINYFNSSYDPGQERRDIALWLSPLNFKASQSDFLQAHEEGTGNWLFESQTFQDWRDGSSQTLWCPGNPGAGKTILASLVIDHLQTSFKDSNVGVAYIFCNHKEQTTQIPPHLIGSLLKQLVQDSTAISDNVKVLYHYHRDRSTNPTLDEFTKALKTEVKAYEKLFIVVDALDECAESDGSQLKILKALRSLVGPANLMVTSRDLPSIERHFSQASRLDIRATDTDVEKYIQTQINDYPDFFNMRNTIAKKIVDNARGMFLLARLQMSAIVEQDCEEAVLHVLDNFPEEMDPIYAQAMERIERSRNTRELAKRVLSWLAGARRLLTVKELQYGLAISPEMTEMNARASVFEVKLASVCAGLVVIDKEQRIIRLVHHTAQQYFEKYYESLFPSAEAAMAATCLQYLSFETFAHGYCDNDAEFESFLKDHPLLDYTARNWYHHARRHQEIVKNRAIAFLRNDSKVACASQAMLVSVRRWPGYSGEFPRCFSGVHLAASGGLEQIVGCELDNGADPNKVDSYGRTPLSYAAMHGHEEVVKLLLSRNDVEIETRDLNGQTPLSHAAENGHEAVVKLLLARNDVNADRKDSSGRTPLIYAAEGGHEAVVKLLVTRDDVKADSKDSSGRTPLLFAARSGREAVVKLLVARDDVEVKVKDLFGRAPLSYAAENGHVAVMKVLFYRDDVEADTKDPSGETPLLLAVKGGHEAVVELLLNRDDIDPDSKNNYDQTPLSCAAESGCEAVVKLLLAQDNVDANWKDSFGRTPLSYAEGGGYDSIVKLLLARGDVKKELKES